MKKLLLSFTAIVAGGMLFAQSTASVLCPNLIMTNSTGQKRDLYAELAKGKIIVLDLFFCNCAACIGNAPAIEKAFKNHGSGTGNIDFWGINVKGEGAPGINAYKTKYNITNQCFGGQEGKAAGQAIHNTFEPASTSYGNPLYAVVCPDKKTFYKVNGPPASATGFDTYFAQCGTVGVNNITHDENHARFVSVYPNPSNNASKVDFFLSEKGHVQIAIFNLLGEQVSVLANEIFDMGTHTLDFSTTFLPSGNYLIKMITDSGVADVAKITIVN